MHSYNINVRNAEARRRIKDAAAALANGLGLPALGEVTGIEQRDHAVAQMRELEEIATLLEGVARALMQEKRT
jgi:hypothetical protein